MREYIFSVVCAAALGGAVIMIAPDGVRSGLKKHVKLVCALCLLCVLIAPGGKLIGVIKDGFGDINFSGPGAENELQSIYESMYEDNLELGFGDGLGELVKDKLFEKFSVPRDGCRVSVSFKDGDGDGFREPLKITVILSGASIFKEPRAIENYISDVFGCECTCAIE